MSHTLAPGNIRTGRWDARYERIASESTRTLADSDVISDGTFGVDAAWGRTRIDAAEIMTNFVAGTFAIF